MKHIAYSHSRNRSLVETLGSTVWHVLAARLLPPTDATGGHPLRRRIVGTLLLCLALAIQAALLVLIAELVETIHGVMELYLDLASIQLDLQSTYIAATTPK
jgi:hypothetical protein